MSAEYTAEEQLAWDAYFAAALPLAKEQAVATQNKVTNLWENVIADAANLADNMIVERRKRVPKPEYYVGGL